MSKRYVLAVVSDVHAGGTTALCPESVPLDDGGEYRASKAQRWLFGNWEKYWAEVAKVRDEESAELIAVFNGDLVDGAHHKTTQVITENPNAQAAVVNAAMAIPLALKPDHIVVVRGTEAHVGQSASAEERIADGLKRDKRPIACDPDTGTSSWWHWRAEIEGVRLDVTHHGRTGMREHTRGGAIVLYAHDILLAHVKQDHLPPHVCFRAHYHRFNDSGPDACPVRVFQTGAWQLGTSYVKKVAADTLADCGGAIMRIQDGGYDLRKVEFKPESRGAVWRPL